MRKTLEKINNSNAVSSLLAIVVGLLAGLIILFVSNPAQALNGFWAILTGGGRNLGYLGNVLYFATPIILTGLSVGFAGRTGLFNIGASGQFIAGAYAAVWVGVKCAFLPGHLHWITAVLAAAAAGALWGAVPGVLKALRNVNEVIACIMMNYIGMYFVNYMIRNTIYDSLKAQSQRVMETANIPKLGFDRIFREGNIPSSANAGILIAIFFAVVMFILLDKTTFGFELKACGFNRDAAKYAGVNEKRSIILSMVIAGALAGIAGGLLYLAGSGKGITVVDELAAEGFNGIPVALLALNHPVGIIFSGLLIAYLQVSSTNIQRLNFQPELIEIIIAVIIYFSAFAMLLKNWLARLAAVKGRRGNE